MAGFKNLDSLISKLTALDGSGNQAIRQGIEKGTKRVQRTAKQLCPVDEGTLRNSIVTEVAEKNEVIVGAVKTNLEYAPYVEFGTGQKGQSGEAFRSSAHSVKDAHFGKDVLKYPGELNYRQDWKGMPAQPFLYPALKHNEEAVKGDVAKELLKEIRKLEKQ